MSHAVRVYIIQITETKEEARKELERIMGILYRERVPHKSQIIDDTGVITDRTYDTWQKNSEAWLEKSELIPNMPWAEGEEG